MEKRNYRGKFSEQKLLEGIQKLNGTDHVPSVDRIMNIKDRSKRKLCQKLLYKWMAQRVGDDWVFVKHIPSGRQNVLFQIVLSGHSWDGVYEFSLKGFSVSVAYTYDHRLDEQILNVNSPGNYVMVTQQIGEEEIHMGRIDCNCTSEFEQRLVNAGMVCKEEFSIFSASSSYEKDLIARYLDKISVE
jgi:hypothetical protein